MNMATQLSEDLGVRHLYERCTVDNLFIRGFADGHLPVGEFDSWIVQDYIFVRAFTYFTCVTVRALVEANDDNNEPLVKIMGTDIFPNLVKELELFKTKAASRSISLPDLPALGATLNDEIEASSNGVLSRAIAQLVPLNKDNKGCLAPYNRVYIEWLLNLADSKSSSWQTLVAAIWAMENCYRDAFHFVAHSDRFYKAYDKSIINFVEWWGKNPDFDHYVDVLTQQVRSIITLYPESVSSIKDCVINIFEFEREFFHGILD